MLDDESSFRAALDDLVDQMDDFVMSQQHYNAEDLRAYGEWLKKILDHVKGLRRKDFF